MKTLILYSMRIPFPFFSYNINQHLTKISFSRLPFLTILLLFCLSVLNLAYSQQELKKTTLFQEDEELNARLSYSFKDIKSKKSDEKWKSGFLYYENETQDWDSIAVLMRGRGNFRRETCFFTPIKLKMKKKAVKGTVFAGNKSLKMVLPCQNAKDASDFLVKEYISYKLYEPLSPYHFNTRLIHLNLTDERGKNQKEYEVKAILIEDDKLVAKRFDAQMYKGDVLNPHRLQNTTIVIHDFSQFFIGNTDWSARNLHNVSIMQLSDGNYIPLCYDFDMAGMVNSNYATVSEMLTINSVTERLYRGLCKDEALYQYVRAHYIERESSIWQAFEQASVHLDPKMIPGMKRYITDFFDILKNDRLFKEEVFSKCRNV
jgi:hypothetical protein